MTKKNNREDKGEINNKIKELIIARIDAKLPSNLKLSIGSEGSLSKDEMIKHVREGDEQGKQIVNMHINFIKAVVSGDLMKQVNSI